MLKDDGMSEEELRDTAEHERELAREQRRQPLFSGPSTGVPMPDELEPYGVYTAESGLGWPSGKYDPAMTPPPAEPWQAHGIKMSPGTMAQHLYGRAYEALNEDEQAAVWDEIAKQDVPEWDPDDCEPDPGEPGTLVPGQRVRVPAFELWPLVGRWYLEVPYNHATYGWPVLWRIRLRRCEW